jgi:tetratricopeptide (TPR) repeat protein
LKLARPELKKIRMPGNGGTMRKRNNLSLVVAIVTLLALTAGTELTSGKIYNQNKQFDEAVTILKVAMEKEPDNWEVYYQIGYSYSNLDSVALAYESFSRAKELNSKKATADSDNNILSNYARHYKLGQAAFGRQDYATAAQEFGVASLADPRQSASHFNRAVAFSRLAESDSTYAPRTLHEAEQALELSGPDDPNYTKALSLVGRELIALGRVDDAPARFQKLIEESPTNFGVLEEIGNDALGRSQWKGAAVFLGLAADARSAAGMESFETYYNAGVANYSLGRQQAEAGAPADESLGKASAFYEKALQMRPDDPQTTLNLVATNVVRKDWAEASLWGERYVSQNSSDPRGWQFLARIYTEMGEKEKAADAMKRFEALRSQ